MDKFYASLILKNTVTGGNGSFVPQAGSAEWKIDPNQVAG